MFQLDAMKTFAHERTFSSIVLDKMEKAQYPKPREGRWRGLGKSYLQAEEV